MSKAPENADITHNSSSKRSHQWFIDSAESAELFPNKKQAVEVPHPNSYTALLNSNIYCGNSSSSFHSVTGQFTERLFDNEMPRTANFDDRKVVEDPFGMDSTFGLSISHPLVEPRSGISYGGIRKVKVNQVKDAEDFIPVSLGHAYSTEDIYSKGDEDPVTMGLSFDRGNDSMMSMSDTFNRGDNSFTPYNNGPSASKDNTTMTQSFIKEDENNTAIDTFNRHNDAISMDQVYGKVDGIRVTSSTTDSSSISMMRHSFGNGGENNIISFGGLNNDAYNHISSSGRLVCNYDFLMGQSSIQRSEENSLSESTSCAINNIISSIQATAPGDAILKKKEQKATKKKTPPNNFPSNVRSLLSTGMLDGVPVKYVAWSREKELRGVIKGAAYLCGCQSCTFSKEINAFEFERHAGCKTKHPNNHIYFENGKTIYGVVQELRNTPQNVLFEVIQTITGSPINQKSFRLWKESFLAATRELQRIYGKEEGKDCVIGS